LSTVRPPARAKYSQASRTLSVEPEKNREMKVSALGTSRAAVA
jgi:hypothetical protein